MFIAVGTALHLYTGERVSLHIDAVFSHRITLPEDLEIAYRDADGTARLRDCAIALFSTASTTTHCPSCTKTRTRIPYRSPRFVHHIIATLQFKATVPCSRPLFES